MADDLPTQRARALYPPQDGGQPGNDRNAEARASYVRGWNDAAHEIAIRQQAARRLVRGPLRSSVDVHEVLGEWVASPGFYACAPNLPAPHNEAHWHSESHEESHRMGRPRDGARHCMERGCNYREVRV